MSSVRWLLPVAALAFVAVAGCIGVTRGAFYDAESSLNNDFQAWTASVWLQTSPEDFTSGVLFQTDASSDPGNIILSNSGVYSLNGTIASRVLDTSVPGEAWNALTWDVSLETGTSVSFEVRAADSIFAAGNALPGWLDAGGVSPVMSGLPTGRYMQWRATLSTSDNTVTPVLHEVRVYHYED